MEILAIANLKGGVGKTTLAFNFAGVLAEKGFKVLLVDCDHQANLTDVARAEVYDPEAESPLYRVLVKNEPIASLIEPTRNERIWLLGSEYDISFLENDLQEEANVDSLLREKLEQVQRDYDYVVLDCPPNPGLPTRMALVASTAYLVPLEAQRYSLSGVQNLTRIVTKLQRVNDSLRLLGYVINRLKPRANVTRAYVDQYEKRLGEQIFEKRLKDSVKYQEAVAAGKPITDYIPGSPLADDVRQLVKESGIV